MSKTINRADVIRRLDELIEIGKDVRDSLERAAVATLEARARAVFLRAMLQRVRVVHELQTEVRRLGGDPSTSDRALGRLHRSWIDLRAAHDAHDAEGALAACEGGDGQTLEAYRDALAAALPTRTRALLRRQEAEIRFLHGWLCALRSCRVRRGTAPHREERASAVEFGVRIARHSRAPGWARPQAPAHPTRGAA